MTVEYNPYMDEVLYGDPFKVMEIVYTRKQ